MHKILFAGPVGAGKSSAISAVSDTPVVSTEARASDEVLLRKPSTTVALDYGTLKVHDSLTIQLVGAPGQERFDFMWEILARGAIGLALLIDNARPDPLADLHLYLNAFADLIERQRAAAVVCITRCDLADDVSLERYRSEVRRIGLDLPVIELDARSREDVKTLLLIQAAMLNPRVHRQRAS